MPGTIDFRRVFEATAESQLLLDDQNRVVVVSDGYLRAVGLPRDAVAQRSLFELPPYAGNAAAMQHVADGIATSRRTRTPIPHDLRDSLGEHAAQSTSEAVTDSDGGLAYVLHRLGSTGTILHVPPRDAHQLRKLIEQSYDAFLLLDGYGRPLYISPTIERVCGYSEQEFMRLAPMALVHPDDMSRAGAEVIALLAAPGSVLLTRVRMRQPDGSWRTIEAAVVNQLQDPELATVVATLRDVTQRVALEQELTRSSEQLRVALAAAGAICWDWAPSTRKATYSSDFAEFFGVQSAGYHARDIALAVHPDDRRNVLEIVDRCVLTGEAFNAEFRGPPGAKGVRWYASHGQVFRDPSGKAERMVGVAWDVTETKRLQDERKGLEHRIEEGQKLESLGVLAGGIAHDFNNILMAILGNASLLRRKLGDDTGSQYLTQIEEASRRAADLCRQMLAYAGKGRFVLQRADLNVLIEETTHLLQVSVSKKAVLRFHLDRRLPAIVADVTQMRQVIMNLVINASDAIGDRSGVISIGTGVVRADRNYLDKTFLAPEIPVGDYVFLEVSDTGGGMTAETQSRIFEPFFSTKFTGRGLGLAAVLGIVRGHSGALKVYSELGKGSSFKFLLPAAYDESEDPAARGQHTGQRPVVARGTILVVDDEETVRAVASHMLESLGFSVLHAADGREAIETYGQHAGEVIGVLMDLTMPHLDGEEAFRELRRHNPDVRVLLMSGYNEQDAIARFVGKGLAGFIQKPFNIEELREGLRLLLG